jgi:hypothetical protein
MTSASSLVMWAVVSSSKSNTRLLCRDSDTALAGIGKSASFSLSLLGISSSSRGITSGGIGMDRRFRNKGLEKASWFA